jgi:hypothetical protein
MSQTGNVDSESSAKPEKDTLDVFVFPPRDPNRREEFHWSKHLEVGKAAEEAATFFGYSGDRTKQLVAEHVHDGEVLGLVDVAGGV